MCVFKFLVSIINNDSNDNSFPEKHLMINDTH